MTTPYVDPVTLHNPTSGGKPPYQWGDTIRDDLEFLIAPPSCKVIRTTDLTVATGGGSPTGIPFDTSSDVWDTDSFHSTTTNPSRLTVPFTGRYRFEANVLWDGSSTAGYRQIYLRKGGSTLLAQVVDNADQGSWVAQYVAAEVGMVAGDYVEVVPIQSSGANRTILGAGYPLWFSVCWVSRWTP